MKGHRRLKYLAPAVLALVFATAQAADANTALANGAVVTGTAGHDYQYTAAWDYWSVSAVASTASSDYNLYVDDSVGDYLAASTYPAGYTNFVAVDSNSGTRSLPQTYQADVTVPHSGQYWAQAQYGAKEIGIPAPTHQGTTGFADPDISFMTLDGNDVVSISDIYLTAGESFWASTSTAAQQMYLLEADPSNSYSFVQSRTIAAIRQHTQVIDGCTLYTASITGWHALVLVSDTQPVSTSPQQGIGIGLHQYDPTNPGYCPMADFPGPTPAP